MNNVVLGFALPIIAIASIMVSPVASATTASNNAGSIIKISNTCVGMADLASHNAGSIIKIDGGGQCDIKDILAGSTVTGNAGSIIKITNVCGDTSNIANNNAGSIIKIEGNGACKKDVPTTVVITDDKTPVVVTPVVKDTTPVQTVSTTPVTTPVELPRTGLGLQGLGTIAVLSSAVYLVALLVNRHRAI